MRVGQTRRRDTAEAAIVKALRAAGAVVIQISGKGAPDLFVCLGGQMWGAEVKSGTGTLTPAQVDSGAGRLWPIWRTPADALRTIGVLL
ncbi:hypothetical protein UFOVP1236_19 [uncultured Caudovirales phage]|uniref:VRR-NUC domain containing protein n=1 Tax=uncultured Caudovirales phage TaxID=2100421 RepID=A0A6J5R5K5_9CAUD|nr:hypothetical protein UFOVP1236_19 [uncultured Caudovirales phage]